MRRLGGFAELIWGFCISLLSRIEALTALFSSSSLQFRVNFQFNELDLGIGANGLKMPNNLGNCGKVKVWEVIPAKIEGSTGTSMCC